VQNDSELLARSAGQLRSRFESDDREYIWDTEYISRLDSVGVSDECRDHKHSSGVCTWDVASMFVRVAHKHKVPERPNGARPLGCGL